MLTSYKGFRKDYISFTALDFIKIVNKIIIFLCIGIRSKMKTFFFITHESNAFTRIIKNFKTIYIKTEQLLVFLLLENRRFRAIK